MKPRGQPPHFTNEEIEVQAGRGSSVGLLQDLGGPGPSYPILWFFHPLQALCSRDWPVTARLSLFFHLLFCHCSPPGNECPGLQPPVHGKIEPLQAKYFFKDQVLISCDTGYKVLKVQGPAWEVGATRSQTFSRAPGASGFPELVMVPPQYFPASP